MSLTHWQMLSEPVFKSKYFKNGKIKVAFYVKNGCIGSLYYYLDGECIYISYLYITPKYQRRGYGSSLINKVLEYEKTISLHVSIANTDAIAFYKKAGFTITLVIKSKNHYLMSMTVS